MLQPSPTPLIWFFRAVALCYERPESAIRRVYRFKDSWGEERLVAMLASQPRYFGRYLADDARRRKALPKHRLNEIKQAALLLPLLARDAFVVDAPRADVTHERAA